MTAGAPGIAIVGMAARLPGAPDLETYWQNLLVGFDAIVDAPADRLDPVFYEPSASAPDRVYCRRGGFLGSAVTFDASRFGIMPVAAEGAEPDQLLALEVAARALADAGYADRPFPRERASVVLGRGGYLTAGVARLEQRVRGAELVARSLRALVPGITEAQIAAVKAEIQNELGPYGADTAIGLVPNLAASRIANRLDLRGGAYTIDAACASSLVAVDHACRDLDASIADLAIAGGVHLCHDPTFYSVFCQLGALSRTESIRPFDARADGLVIGEGVGMVVLKRLADAERDGDRVYAVIRGTGVSSDGRSASLMTPAIEGQVLALGRAWQRAQLDPASVGLVEAHGTATPAGDAAELATLARVFGPASATSRRAVLGSVKSMIGHTMPAAGVAGLIKAALAVHHGVLLPTLHCDTPRAELSATRFRTIARSEPWETRAGEPRRAAVNAFGFGGANAHVVLEQHRAPSADTAGPVPRHQPPVRRGDDAQAGVRASPQNIAEQAHPGAPVGSSGISRTHEADPAAEPEERLVLLAAATREALIKALIEAEPAILAGAHVPASNLDAPCRVAIVAPTAERIARAKAVVSRGEPWRGRDDIWFTSRGLVSEGGKVAVLFPGVDSSFAPRVDDVARRFGRPCALPEDTSSLKGLGMGIIAVGRLFDGVLRDLGVRADVMAGHSIGEWSGMIASEMIPREHVDAIIAGLAPEQVDVPGVVFVAAGCGVNKALSAIAGLGSIAVSHDNCPHQVLLCGREDSAGEAVARLSKASVLCQKLPFRSGYHSPLFADYVGPHQRVLSHLPLAAPSVPLWSATTCAPYPSDPEEVRRLAVRHVVEPVRFRELTLSLYEHGVRVFVQAGTGSLVGFVGDTLRGRPHLVASANIPTRSGLAQLLRLAAALAVEGVSIDLERCLGLQNKAEKSCPPPAALRASAPPKAPASPAQGGDRLGKTEGALDSSSLVSRSFSLASATPVRDVSRPSSAAWESASNEPDRLVPKPFSSPSATPGRDTSRAFTLVEGVPSDPDRLISKGSSTPSAAPARTSSARLVELPLGVPLFTPSGPLAIAEAPPSRRIEGAAFDEGDPLAAEYAASVRELTAAQDEILAALAAARGPALPAQREVVLRHELSVDAYPALVDHAFYRQRAGWTSMEDRYPVVPMTMLLSLMMDAARELVPERIPIGLERVRALRWLAVAPPVEVLVAATFDGESKVEVTIDGYASGVVEVASVYPAAPRADRAPLAHEAPARITARQLYGDRWMFHGPAYQGVVALGALGKDGIRGTLVSLAAKGGLLDNAGQLLGYWVMQNAALDRLAMPVLLERVRFFAPEPPPGERLDCTVRIRDLDASLVRADVELARDGRVWCRIEGWEDRRFDTDERVWNVLMFPEKNLVTEMRHEGFGVLRQPWRAAASRDLLARRYLTEKERRDQQKVGPRGKGEWLLARMAIKDCARRFLWDRGHGPLFPAEIEIDAEPSGRPVVRGPFREPLHVSAAHKQGLVVARVAEGRACGIDLERIEPRSADFEELAFTASERALLPGLAGTGPRGEGAAPGEVTARDVAITRFWVAKEAAAKARGTGLAGNPSRFVVREVTGDRLLVGAEGESLWVETLHLDKDHIVGWTST